MLDVLGAQECFLIATDQSVFSPTSVNVNASAATSPTGTAAREREAGRYYVLDEERLDRSLEATLQTGDVELITLQTGRPIVFTIGGSHNSSNSSSRSGGGSGGGGQEEWGSKRWAVRRHLERATPFTQLHAPASGSSPASVPGSGGATAGITTARGIPRGSAGVGADQAGPIHVMTIPYSVSEYTTAVIVIVRRTVAFSDEDKDCLAHLLKLSALSM